MPRGLCEATNDSLRHGLAAAKLLQGHVADVEAVLARRLGRVWSQSATVRVRLRRIGATSVRDGRSKRQEEQRMAETGRAETVAVHLHNIHGLMGRASEMTVDTAVSRSPSSGGAITLQSQPSTSAAQIKRPNTSPPRLDFAALPSCQRGLPARSRKGSHRHMPPPRRN